MYKKFEHFGQIFVKKYGRQGLQRMTEALADHFGVQFCGPRVAAGNRGCVKELFVNWF